MFLSPGKIKKYHLPVGFEVFCISGGPFEKSSSANLSRQFGTKDFKNGCPNKKQGRWDVG